MRKRRHNSIIAGIIMLGVLLPSASAVFAQPISLPSGNPAAGIDTGGTGFNGGSTSANPSNSSAMPGSISVPSGYMGGSTVVPSGAGLSDPGGATAVDPQAREAAGQEKPEKPAVMQPPANCGFTGASILGCFGYVTYWFFVASGWLAGLSGMILNYVIYNWVVTLGSKTVTLQAVTDVWGIFRDLANLLIVFLLIVVGLATILRFESWGYKQLLAKVLIAALLVNFSLFFTKVIIDVSNLFASQLHDTVLATAYQNVNQGGNCSVVGTELIDPDCFNKGLSGAFMQVLAIPSMMQSTGGQLKVDDAQYLMVTSFGGLVFLVLFVVFLAAAIQLLARALILLLLMAFSPLWFVGILIGKFGRDFFQMLVKNAIYAPAFFLLLWVTFIFATTALPQANGNWANLITSPTANGSWALVVNYLIIIGFLVLAMQIAGKLGAFGAATALGMATAVGAGGLAAAGGTALLGAKQAHMRVVSPGMRRASAAYDRKFGKTTFGKSYIGTKFSNVLESGGKAVTEHEKRKSARAEIMEKRQKHAEIDSMEKNPKAFYASLSAADMEGRMEKLGRKHVLDEMVEHADKMSTETLNSVLGNEKFHLNQGEKDRIIDGHFSGLNEKFGALAMTDGIADDTERKAAKEQAQDDIYRTVQGFNNSQLKLFGERRMQKLHEENPEQFAEFAKGLTKNQLKYISTEPTFSEQIETDIKDARYKEVNDRFGELRRTEERHGADSDEAKVSRQAFQKEFRKFDMDEHAHGSILNALDSPEAVHSFTDSLSQRDFEQALKSKEWDEQWQKKFVESRVRKVQKALDDIERDGATDTHIGTLKDELKHYNAETLKLIDNTIANGSPDQQKAFAAAMKPAHFEDLKKNGASPKLLETLSGHRAEHRLEELRRDETTFGTWLNDRAKGSLKEEPKQVLRDVFDASKRTDDELRKAVGQLKSSNLSEIATLDSQTVHQVAAAIKKVYADAHAQGTVNNELRKVVDELAKNQFTRQPFGTSEIDFPGY